jgi:hypothetical protein
MVATLVDLSRRGDTGGFVVPEVFAAADALLRTWMAAANAQNPTQQLSIVKAPGDVPGFTGWVIKARLAVLDAGQPVELMSQWVANLTTGALTTHCGLVSGYTPGAALGGYGALTGGVGTTNTLIEPLPEPLPVGGLVASSLAAGQEYFCFAHSQHTFSNRQAVVVLIAKDVYSGQWHLSLTDNASVIGVVGWRANRSLPFLSNALRLDYASSTLPLMLTVPVQWVPITPGIAAATPPAVNPPVQWFDPVVLPADFGLYNRTAGMFGYFIGSDGSHWLQMGGARLALRVVEATP